ncbi:ABC transporter permease [Bacillota bacterium Meth-B3]|nr:ABC transporter permease [Christensenellaceae bacterium]MEA5067342.1 ABC transporter permease [Eubacteriales bacterium]
MRNYLIRRVLQMIPVFIVIMIAVFLLIHSAPGDPVTGMIDPKMTPEMKEHLRATMGLDQPLWKQFASWVSQLLSGNLGYSTYFKKPVADVIGSFIFPTFILALFALVLSLAIGIPAGIVSATRQYSTGDNVLSVFSLVGLSMPTFFFGILLIKFLSVDFGWFPMFGMMDQAVRNAPWHVKTVNILHHMVLPGIVLGLGQTASFMRYTRSAMLDVIRQDYIRTARAKGLREKVVIYRHALRNAMIPIITLLGFQLPGLLSGAVMTESVFGWPGLGKVGVDAIFHRDYPLLMTINMMDTFLLMAGMLLSDILYGVVDPRIKYD